MNRLRHLISALIFAVSACVPEPENHPPIDRTIDLVHSFISATAGLPHCDGLLERIRNDIEPNGFAVVAESAHDRIALRDISAEITIALSDVEGPAKTRRKVLATIGKVSEPSAARRAGSFQGDVETQCALEAAAVSRNTLPDDSENIAHKAAEIIMRNRGCIAMLQDLKQEYGDQVLSYEVQENVDGYRYIFHLHFPDGTEVMIKATPKYEGNIRSIEVHIEKKRPDQVTPTTWTGIIIAKCKNEF